MPKLETLLLWAWCIVWPAYQAIHDCQGTEVSGLVEVTACVGFFVAVIAWVFADAHHRGVRLYYDFDLLIAVCWPVTLVCYLFSSRGMRAILTLLYTASMWLAANASHYAVWWILYACLA